MNQQQLESAWLSSMRQAWGRVYVGIDHHSRQFTLSAASGGQLQAHQRAQGAGWMPVEVFSQDGLGYVALLDWLFERFPEVPKDQFVFVSEPTFSQPLCHFLAMAGFEPSQILWVKTTEVGPYRKAKDIGKAGKNDHDDARTLATMAFEEAVLPLERRRLFMAAPHAPVAEGLRHLADDHARVSRQLVAVKNQVTDLVLRLFPECRRVWSKVERGRKPDGSIYEQRLLNLFGGKLPMRLLGEYPTARAVAEAGFDTL
ncbi:MAG: transposase, partial [Candidatus Sericytochromatia bacterium]